MGTNEEMERLVEAERKRLEQLRERDSQFRECVKSRFAPLLSKLEELVAGVPEIQAHLQPWGEARLSVGQAPYWSSWEIRPAVEKMVAEGNSSELFANDAHLLEFCVEEVVQRDDDVKTRKETFATEDEVIAFLKPALVRAVAFLRRFHSTGRG